MHNSTNLDGQFFSKVVSRISSDTTEARSAFDDTRQTSNVVIIAGRGLAFKEADLIKSALEQKGIKVNMIGDGKRDLSEAEVKAELAKISEPSTLIAVMHGGKDGDGRFFVGMNNSGENNYIDKIIFDNCNENIRSVLITGCHSGAIFNGNQIGHLKKGTEVYAFSNPDDIVLGIEHLNFAGSLKDNQHIKSRLSAKQLWNDFITTDVEKNAMTFLNPDDKSGFNSKYGIAGIGVYDLKDQVSNLKGHDFSKQEMKEIFSELESSSLPKETIINVVEAIKKGNVADNDLNIAVAIANVLRNDAKTLGKDDLKNLKNPKDLFSPEKLEQFKNKPGEGRN